VSSAEKINILIVDDVPVNLTLMAKMLKNLDLNIVKANSGREALELMQEYDFALVLLDVQMPEMDGFEVSAQIRGNEKTKNVPIIFVTAIDQEDNSISRGYEIGAVDFLFKPVDKHILRSKVIIFLELYEQKRSLENTTHNLQQTVHELETSKRIIEEKNKQLSNIAIHDGLTGLFNHRQMDKILKQEFRRALRYQNDLSCLLIDLDFFKVVNDTYGHAFGDFVLKGFSRIVGSVTRESDFAFRYGGEEFMILLPQTDIHGAQTVAEKLRATCEDYIYHDGTNSTSVTISVGVASLYHNGPTQPETLLAYADKAVYQAKADGRNQVRTYFKDSPPLAKAGGQADKDINYLKQHLLSVLEKTKKSYMASLELLVRDMTDNQFHNYDRRVQLCMELIGQKMRLPEPIVDTFKRAVSLHNCFSVLLGEGTVSFKESLADEEKAGTESHPYVLVGLTKLFDFFLDERSILQYHHEHYDGSGFPEGLEGDQIPLGARIFAIVDAIIDMTTELPDRKAFSTEMVLKELAGNAGIRFDPMLVNLFKGLIEENELLIRRGDLPDASGEEH